MNAVFIMMRFVFCLIGAAAFLYTLSYPDNILPPNPAWEEAEGLTPYSFKPYIWVLPLIMMEMVSGAGRRRNLVWFSSLFAVLVLALLAYPVLAAHRPEYVEPTFSYQGGMLSTGLSYYAVFTAISLVVRLVILAYMFPAEELQEQLEVGFVSASALDPAKACTLKEIAAKARAAAPRFQFKDSNSHFAVRFRLIMKRLMIRNRIINSCIAIGVLTLSLWVWLYPQPSAEEAFERDKKLMFSHRTNKHGQQLATTAAVHAAARAMKYISDHESLGGMSREEAEAWLGIDQVPEAYRAWLRDEREVKLASTNYVYESRTRFLTVTDGRRIAVLFIRTNPADESIVVAELQDAGWDAAADEARRRMGTDWGALYH